MTVVLPAFAFTASATVVAATENADVALVVAGLVVAGLVVVALVVAGLLRATRAARRRRVAAAARQRRITAFHAASPVGIAELDLELTITGCNAVLLRLLGMQEQDVVGRPAVSLIHSSSPPPDPDVLQQLLTGARSTARAHRLLRHADGHGVPVQLDWGVVRDTAAGSDVLGLVCVMTDVSGQEPCGSSWSGPANGPRCCGGRPRSASSRRRRTVSSSG